MAGTSGHTLEILVQAKDAATGILKGINSVFKEMGGAATDSAKQAGTALVDMSAQAKKLKVTLDEVASSLAGVGIAAAGMGATMTAGFGVAIKGASDFEAAVTGVRAVLQSDFMGNVTGLNTTMGQLADKARELGTTTQFSAVQAANAMEDLAKAGYKTNEIMASSDAVLKLAAASQMGLADTAEAVVNILTPFGLKAEAAAKTTNTLAVVANETTSGLRDITEAMKFAAPAAASLNLSIEETAAAIGVLADNGMKGTIAGTSLRGIFIDLVKPTKQAQEALKNMGVELVKNADGSFNAIATFKALRDAQMTLADSAAIFGVHQATAALALAKNVDKFGELTEKTRTQTTALDDLTNTVTGSFSVSIQKLLSSLQVLAESLGTPLLEPLKAVVLQIIEGVKWLTDFARAHETLTKYVLGAIGAVGGILTVFGAVSLALAGLLWALGSMRQAWITMIAVWERGIILSLKAEAATIAESAARQKNAAAARAEAEAVGMANQAKGGAAGGASWGATARSALPGVGVAAGIAGAALANMADWDKDLKGINTSLLDISAIASILPGKFGVIGQAITAWASATVAVGANWEELTTNLKEDFGTIGWLITGLLAPLKAVYDGVTWFLGKIGLVAKEIPLATQAQKDFTRASVEMGESWAQFQKSYAATFGTRPPAEIAKQFGELRREAKGAGDSGKQAGTDFATGMTEAAKATRLTATEQQELEKQSKTLADALKGAFQTLKDQTVGVFGGINASIKSFEEQWQATSKRTGTASQETQKAFSTFAERLGSGIGEAARYVSEQMTTLSQRLRSAIDSKALQPELDAMKKGITDFANSSIKEFERWVAEADKSIKSLQTEYDRVNKEIVKTHEEAERQRQQISDNAENAIRNIMRSGMNEREKYLETIDKIRERQEEADDLIAAGGEENYRRAQQLLNQNIQDAQTLKEVKLQIRDTLSQAELAAYAQEIYYIESKKTKTEEEKVRLKLINDYLNQRVTVISQQEAQERAINSVQEARASLEKQAEERDNEQTAELERQKKAFEEQLGKLQALKAEAEKLINVFKQQLAVTVDTSAAETSMNELFRPREIPITMKVTTQGQGMATGGPLPGYGGGDVIPAMLEPGEFVVRKEAVSSVGLGLLTAINNFGGGVSSALRSAFSGFGVQHFQSGGLVTGITERVIYALEGLSTQIERLVSMLSSAQQTIAYQQAGSSQQYGGGNQQEAFLRGLSDTLSPLISALGDIARTSTELQRVEVRVQDGMNSTQTTSFP
ncbi:MAG: phage tail tape measure protein [Patescibacteria group bacterium]